MTNSNLDDLTACEVLDVHEIACVSGGKSPQLTSASAGRTRYKPGTQADIDTLSTSLFGGPLFPGLEPEFPG